MKYKSTNGRVVVVEGTVYDENTDSGRRGIHDDANENHWIESLLPEGARVRVTIEILEPAP